MRHRPLALLCTLLLAGTLAAQGGGFASTDLLLYSPAIQGSSSDDGALVLVDLAGGTATILVDTFSTQQNIGSVAFDPWRQRVIFQAGLFDVFQPKRLWAVNAAGQLDDLGLSGQTIDSIAPAGDGRIYFRHSGSPSPIEYLDAAGVLHPLLDATGTAPFTFAAVGDIRGIIHDAATNALFVASNATPCPGGTTLHTYVRKLPLSADGSRVVGPEGCTEFEVSTSGETPVGWSHGPLGQLLLVVDTNSGATAPHVLSVDPVTLAISPFATPGGFFGAAALNAGTWSTALGKVVLLDTGSDVLRAFGAGETGAGTTLAITGTVSASGSGEVATLVEVGASGCAGGWSPYGAGLAGAGGQVPALTGSGCPQIGGVFALQVANGVGGATGTLFIGLAPANVPFKGGTFLVGSVLLQLGIALGGAPGVPGAGSLTLPAGLPPDPLLQGIQLLLQVGLADADAVKGASLTNGLRMEIG